MSLMYNIMMLFHVSAFAQSFTGLRIFIDNVSASYGTRNISNMCLETTNGASMAKASTVNVL